MKNFLILCFLILFPIHPAFAIQKFDSIKVLDLSGTEQQMGLQYGRELKNDLKQELAIIKNFYITKNKISYKKLQAQAELFYNRFPENYQLFIQGIAKGADISLSDAKILNAMETLGELLSPSNVAKCAFVSIPHTQTTTRSTLIGRNYDFSPPLDELSKYVTVTVLHQNNSVPTAFISIAGEIYCPTCVNAKGLFMELNNGMPSGGYAINHEKQSLLINMLQIMQNSTDLEKIEKQLDTLQSDYSLIVNIANKIRVKSYEYSSDLNLVTKTSTPLPNSPFVSTNFYLNTNWENTPTPNDKITWRGVTRRNNLLTLANQSEQFDVSRFKALMDKQIQHGGAAWDATIYQLIFDTNDLSLYIKLNKHQNQWTTIPLGKLLCPSDTCY